MNLRCKIPTVFLSMVCCALSSMATAATSVQLSVDRSDIGMGESIVLTSTLSTASRATRVGYRVLPFLNGKRWGAAEVTDESGQAIHYLPLPHPGPMEIRVLVEPPVTRADLETWIWGDTTAKGATQYFQHTFPFSGDSELAQLRVAVDETAIVYLNGEEIATVSGWQFTTPIPHLDDHLREGDNVIAIAARNSGGLAGLLVRMDTGVDLEEPVLLSGAHWTYFPTAPYGWPYPAEIQGMRPVELGRVDAGPYRQSMADWPTLGDESLLMAGAPMPEEGLFSKPIVINVGQRVLRRPTSSPNQRVGIQFTPGFTPGNNTWASAQAIPLTGPYWSWNRDVQRQQVLWLMESGIDFLIVDWTNHLWGKSHWHERENRANEIVHATTMLFDTLATLRDEGHPVPNIVPYLGLTNGASTTVTAINETLVWIHDTYVRNSRFTELFETYLGKPLVLIHHSAGPEWQDRDGQSRVDTTGFTIRYQSSQHGTNDHGAHGFWSWMDGTLEPVPTVVDGTVEALTVSPAFFGPRGWKHEGALGRHGGWTFLENFRTAQRHRPKFLQIHQFQGFSGQWEGFGFGPEQDIYVDAYSVALSSEIEPVSRSASAYRGTGGWGFYYLNLLRALVDCYHQSEPETTVLVITTPSDGSRVRADELDVGWDWIGREPGPVELRVNNTRVETEAGMKHHALDLSRYPDGPLSITVSAPESLSRYDLSYSSASAPRDTLIPATASTVCIRVTD